MADMGAETRQLIDTGVAHLGRLAFFTRDNPYRSVRASLDLPPPLRGTLGRLLEGGVDVADWLASKEGKTLLKGVRIGCVPRDMRIVARDGESHVAVESVHAFLHARQFWWLVSILWCIDVGRAVDPLLPDTVYGYRLNRGFLADPSTHGTVFRNEHNAYKRWKEFASKAADDHPHMTLAASTVDLKDFYYSVRASPSQIVERFLEANQAELKLTDRARRLTELLDALHARYADQVRRLNPRPPTSENGTGTPLPVGPPSSQVLANLIVSLALWDLSTSPRILAGAVYADDFVFVTDVPPEPGQETKPYLRALGLTTDDDRLASMSAAPSAALSVDFSKSSTVYVRSEPATEGEEAPAPEEHALDVYVEGYPDPDWGGKLRTVLRAPYRRDREPRELQKDICRLVDEVRVGLAPNEAETSVRELVDDLDVGQFLALRSYWTDLLVVSLAAYGPAGVSTLTAEFVKVVDAVEPPAEANARLRRALYRGLRDSWFQALGQAMAVALSDDERHELSQATSFLIQGDDRMDDLATERVVTYADQIRRRKLIPATFVSAPLAEFTAWTGRLIGRDAFEQFITWAIEGSHKTAAQLRSGLARAVRFVPLHEICLAQHLWGAPGSEEWVDEVFALLGSQPLIERESLAELLEQTKTVIAPVPPSAPPDVDNDDCVVRVGVPSIGVPEDQLDAVATGDAQLLGANAATTRKALFAVVLTAVTRKLDMLVLPEWSVLPQHLQWLMNQARHAQMCVVGGETPAVQANVYANRLWTGIPLKDSAGHTACIVPPPRLKQHLSPAERQALTAHSLVQAPPSQVVHAYGWRGIVVASLICFEFADVKTRESLRDLASVLTVSSLNRDWRYFDAIQEATTRDNYCLTVCVNSAAYPGSRIMRPTGSEKSVAASVHGSDDATVVSRTIDMRPILAARATNKRPADCLNAKPRDDTALKDYKPVPPY